MEIPEMLSWVGSVVAMMAFIRGVVPTEYMDYALDRLIQIVSPYTTFVIPEYEHSNTNELYGAVQNYLSTLTSTRARVSYLLMNKNAKAFTFRPARNQRIRDNFNNVRVEWLHDTQERKQSIWVGYDTNTDERRSFKVRMPRAQRDYLLENYLPYIMEKAKELERCNRDLNLYSNKKTERGGGGWNSIPFRHPTSFDTIAMDPEQKLSILADLDDFTHGEEFYRRVGRAWKRGYLLYGPPGTGKTSVVAAMANKLRYDIYDLELTEVNSNADLRKLLLHTSNKSIIVIEDIDCSLDLSGQRKKTKKAPKKKEEEAMLAPRKDGDEDADNKVTLSGLLNFTDGLWSSCGAERIFVFTTNYKEKLDPALLRPGRMDFHIELGRCCYAAFKILAKNFLQIHDHPRFPDVQQIIDSSFLTPADVSEYFTMYKNDPDQAMDKLIEALHTSKANPPPPPDREDENDEKPNEAESTSTPTTLCL